jgi:hypothetical protein
MPLIEVVGSGTSAAPEQLLQPAKVGRTFVNSDCRVAVVAHRPAAGKCIRSGSSMFSAGAHVPVMPLIEVVGSGASAAPEQIAATGAKVGRMFGLTVIVSVAVVAHCPAVGVNV